MSEPHLMRVRTDVVLDVMVRGIHDEAVRRARAEGSGAARHDGNGTQAVLPPLERIGYHARTVERERFAPARAPMPWLAELLARRTADGDDPAAATAAVSGELAAAEPDRRPDPSDGVPSWRVPGPGGHVRHHLAIHAVQAAGAGTKRDWLRGFFARCCEEALAGDA